MQAPTLINKETYLKRFNEINAVVDSIYTPYYKNFVPQFSNGPMGVVCLSIYMIVSGTSKLVDTVTLSDQRKKLSQLSIEIITAETEVLSIHDISILSENIACLFAKIENLRKRILFLEVLDPKKDKNIGMSLIQSSEQEKTYFHTLIFWKMKWQENLGEQNLVNLAVLDETIKGSIYLCKIVKELAGSEQAFNPRICTKERVNQVKQEVINFDRQFPRECNDILIKEINETIDRLLRKNYNACILLEDESLEDFTAI